MVQVGIRWPLWGGAQVTVIFTVISRSLTVTGFVLLCTKPEITQSHTQPETCARCHESQAKAKTECFRAPSLLLVILGSCYLPHLQGRSKFPIGSPWWHFEFATHNKAA